MREDWNARAREDARYFIAFGRRGQDDDEFISTARDVLNRISWEFPRLQAHVPIRARRFLEIGCGIGRLVAPLSEVCGEIHGVDVADEMIRLGRERLRGIPNAYLHWAENSDLSAFDDGGFDLVYSYAVMQHLPSDAPFWRYLSESARVLKPGGVLLEQFNSSRQWPDPPNTWAGITVSAERVLAACVGAGLQVLALEGVGTQYTWLTALRRLRPGAAAQDARRAFQTRSVTGAAAAERVTAGGPTGIAEMFVAQFPPEFCDLNGLAGRLGNVPLTVTRTGWMQADGLVQVTLSVPEATPSGEQSILLTWHGEPITQSFPVLVEPFIRPAPRVLAMTDGIDLLSSRRIFCGTAKIWINNLADAAVVRARVGGLPVTQLDFHCEDSVDQRYQMNLRLPDALTHGQHEFEIEVGAGIVLRGDIVNCATAFVTSAEHRRR